MYLTRYPQGEGKWQVSRGAGEGPTWTPDGKTLYYQSSNRLMSVAFTESPAVTVAAPTTLFDATPLRVSLADSFQVLRDGSFIAVRSLPPENRDVILVQNRLAEFSEEEKR